MIFAIAINDAPDEQRMGNAHLVAKVFVMEGKIAHATPHAVLVEGLASYTELTAILEKYNVDKYVDIIVRVGGRK